MSEFHTGENNAVRVAIMEPGTEARPTTAQFFNLPNVTTSDLPITASSTTKKYYKTNGGSSTKAGAPTWTFTVSGDLPQDRALREPVYRLRRAILDGKSIYIERAFDEDAADTEWEGGKAAITNAALPSPSDNATTYSFTASGSGDPVLPAVPAVVTPTP